MDNFSQTGGFVSRLRRLAKKRRFLLPLVAAIVIAVVYTLTRSGSIIPGTAIVTRTDIVQEISATGKTKPIESVDLSFERSGTVAHVYANAGDTVLAGQAIASLDTSSDWILFEEAQAAKAAAEATLLDLKRGTRSEDLAILRAKLSASEADLSAAEQKLSDTVSDSYTKTDDAVRNYADQFFDNSRSSSPQLNIKVSDTQQKIDLGTSRYKIELMLSDWQRHAMVFSTSSDLLYHAQTVRANLGVVKLFLDALSSVVNALTPDQSLSVATITTYRANVSAARSEVGTALSNLTANEDGLTSARGSRDVSEKNLDQARAGTVPEKIAVQESEVQVEAARVASILHNITIASLRAPIGGVLTRQDGKIGEVAVANTSIASIISKDRLVVEAYVPEADIGAMHVGDQTTVTFDAFSGEEFMGSISYIDPGETVIDAVPTYKVKLALSVNDPRIKPGMTANLSVKVAERMRVLALPYRAVLGKGSDRYVMRLLPDKTTQQVKIILGIRGTNGEVEIISGLSEGDPVLVGTK